MLRKLNSHYEEISLHNRRFMSQARGRQTAPQRRNKSAHVKKILIPFVTQYQQALPGLKRILMGKWHLIQNQQCLREIFKETPIISYRKGKSLIRTTSSPKIHWSVPYTRRLWSCLRHLIVVKILPLMSLNLPLADSSVWNCKAQNSTTIKIILSLDLKKEMIYPSCNKKKSSPHTCA